MESRMVTSALWNNLKSRLGTGRRARGSVALQHLGLSDRDIADLRLVLDKVGEELAVDIELHGHTGDIVLLDVPFASRLSPQLVNAFTEGRPVVLVGDPSDRKEDLFLSAAQRLEARQRALLRQLREIALVRSRSADAGNPHWAPSALQESLPAAPDGPSLSFDAGFDSRLDADQLASATLKQDQQECLQHVMLALRRPAGSAPAPSYAASYGADANLLFDFNARLVFIDPLAQQHLRVRRELPQPARGAKPHTDALVRELDEALWDLGIAAGPFPLLDAPGDWWHCPLRGVGSAKVDRYSRIPRHLDLARRLGQGPVAPSELRRYAKVGVNDLRCFIQACLMVRLIEWVPQSQPHNTGAH